MRKVAVKLGVLSGALAVAAYCVGLSTVGAATADVVAMGLAVAAAAGVAGIAVGLEEQDG